jgi:hypothetical protein
LNATKGGLAATLLVSHFESVFELGFAGFRQRAHAAGADVEAHRHSFNRQPFAMHVRLELPVGPALGETDVMSKGGRFTTNLALPGHQGTPFQRPGDRDWRFLSHVSAAAIATQ